MALTIDDGPSAYTSEINHLLTTYDVKATFFLVGSHIAGHENTLRDLVLSGHELGNHAMRDEPSINLPVEELACQIHIIQRQIVEIYTSAGMAPKQQPKYFRPGSGFFNTAVRHVVKDLGYRLILGSIYPWDAQISWPRLNAWHILSTVRPGSVIVIHERTWTLPMLKILLPRLKGEGWKVATVTQLLDQANAGKQR